MQQYIRLFFGLLLSCTLLFSGTLLLAAAQTSEPPALTLAKSYHPQIDLSHYLVSEKYDGVRAFWDGEKFSTRRGNPIVTPTWFTADFPSTALDGELWAGRGKFEQTVSTIRKHTPVDSQWREIRFMVFDAPDHSGDFTARLTTLKSLLPPQNHLIRLAPQREIHSHQRLQQRLQAIVADGGEGLMLRLKSSRYRAGRSSDLLKVKPYFDAEAVVVAIVPGKGEITGLMGSLRLRRADGSEFKVGSGFTLTQRRQPPAIGSTVSYRYSGLTANGLPRHPRFLRIRHDQKL